MKRYPEEKSYHERMDDELAVEALYEKRMDIAEKILSKRDDAVSFRAGTGVEVRWREDEEMVSDYSTSGYGTPAPVLAYATGVAFKTRKSVTNKSEIKINVVRNRCEIAEGRFNEITLPTSDKNWVLDITPIPEMAEIEKSDDGAYQGGKPVKDKKGNHLSVGDVTREYKEEAEKRMKKMELVIDDQLTECKFDKAQREMQHNAIYLGTGVLKGPSVVKKTNASWKRGEDGIWKSEVIEEATPCSVSLDPRNCFPDPQSGNDVSKGFMWEVDTMRSFDVANLENVPGYDNDMIKKVLEEEPLHVDVIYDDKIGGYKTTDKNMPTGSLYQRWEYNGPIDRKELEDLGCDVEGMGITASKVTACIVFINDKPVKSVLNTLDNNKLPYDFWQWTPVPGSPFGIGLPRRARDLQRVITAAWQKMMDNAGDSSGVNVVLAEGIEPVDGNWTLDGKKAWRALADGAIEDVRKSFAQFQVKNQQPSLQAIIELALKFLDIETGIPTIFQGEMQKQPETLGQTNIIVDSNNISLRMRMSLYDDQVIDPHLTRYYDYNMQFHKDEGIKGDYCVNPRSTRVLLERDNNAKTIAQLFQFKGDPDIYANTDWDSAISQWYADMKVQGVLSTEDERDKKRQEQAESSKQQVQPAVQVAQLRIESQKAELEFKAQLQSQESQFKAEQSQLDRQDKELDRQNDLAMKRMDRDIAIMQMAKEESISIADIKRSLTETSAKLQTQERIADKTGKVKQVLKPATEPPGRAANGEAFQR